MPIKGLSERKRLPRLGKIHLGVKVRNKKGVEHPQAVDYFVCPPEVQAVFGEKPKQLRILFPIEDDERWASQYYRAYSRTRGLVCKGDGERCMRMVDTETGDLANRDSKQVTMQEMACQGRDCPDYGTICHEVMNLQFLLPDVPGLGVWQIDTGSINSIRNINSAAELIAHVYGRISMIPLLLTLEAQEVQDPEGKRKVVHVLNVRTRDTIADMLKTLPALPLGSDAEVDVPVPDDEVPELIGPWNNPPNGDSAETPPSQKEEGQKSEDTKPDRNPSTIKTLGDLFTCCLADFGMYKPQVLEELGVKAESGISQLPAECYTIIAAVREQPPTA